MVNEQQAEEIRLYLIMQMQRNGFGDVVEEANDRIEARREYGEKNYLTNPGELLINFLNEAILTLSGWSSHHLEETIQLLNEALKKSGQETISSISVALTEDKERPLYNLSELPDYRKLIFWLNDIRNTILEDQGDNL
jgi:hypothetical protein